jgi:hypothetical protein
MILRGFARWTLITAQVLDGPPGNCSPSVDFSADPCRFAPAGICISGKPIGYGMTDISDGKLTLTLLINP